METILTILVMGALIYFWCIKSEFSKRTNKNDVVEFFSENGYCIIERPWVWLDVSKNLKKIQKDGEEHFYLEVYGKRNAYYEIWRDAAWDLLIGAMNEKKCCFMEKKGDIIGIGEIRKVPFIVLNKTSKYIKDKEKYNEINEFEKLKNGFGFVPNHYYVKE